MAEGTQLQAGAAATAMGLGGRRWKAWVCCCLEFLGKELLGLSAEGEGEQLMGRPGQGASPGLKLLPKGEEG